MKDNKKILVVEDDEYIRDVYNKILTDAGYNVTVATNGEEGFEEAKKGGFDLIYLDAMMPRLDGMGFLKKLKDTGGLSKNGPVILLSNMNYDLIFNEAKKLGVKDCLIKSDIDPGELQEMTKKYLQ
ncbi:response regulator [Candidatus Woesebacteria bacterium]|nr:response regulator [Candidatus Woesebacteria bacterium]